MASYITQHFFNVSAVSIAKISASSGKSIRGIARGLSDNCKKSYDDINLENDFTQATTQILDFLEKEFPGTPMIPNLTQVQFTSVNFNLDGSQRKKKLFGGTWFNKERSEITDKVEQCMLQVKTHHSLTIAGTLPLAPSGWSFADS